MEIERYVLKSGQTYECSLCGKLYGNPSPFTLAKHFEEVHNYRIEIVSLSPLTFKAVPPAQIDAERERVKLAETDAIKRALWKKTE